MSLSPIPTQQPMVLPRAGSLTPPWLAWFTALYLLIKPVGGNGTTANRPVNGLYIGLQYFDSTLGYPVFIKSLNPTVWVNGAGTVV